MIIMLCGQCQMGMHLDRVKYYHEGGDKYRMKYQMVDENSHKAEITGSIKTYDRESAEARLIQSLIEKTQRLDQASE